MRKFINKIKHRWIEKVLSLIIAIGFWFYVNEQSLPEKYLSLNLVIKNLPQDLMPANQYKDEILLKIKGKESVLAQLSSKNFEAYIDLNNATAGRNFAVVNITKPDLKFKIVKIEPQVIEIELDKVIHKQVPISLTVINEPADGYKKIDEKIYPDKIVIKGPQSIIESINVIRTKPIDIGGISGSVYKDVEFDLPTKFITPVDYKSVKVSIIIVKNFITRTFNDLDIKIVGLAENLKILNRTDLKVKELRLYGPPKKLEELTKNKDFLYIDLSDISLPGTYEKNIKLDLPENCSIISIKPNLLEIKIGE